MKYNVGDKVRIKSIDWYNKNKNKDGIVEFSTHVFFPGMSQFCGKVVTIQDVFEDNYENVDYYIYLMEEIDYDWTDEMIEGLAEEETLIERVDDNVLPFNEWLSHKGAFHVPENYVLKDENGNVINATKIVLEKKKKEVTYPKTYEECINILGGAAIIDIITYYYEKQLETLYKLLICRDAYWKIAGEEIGLGKPWKPKLDNNEMIYYIYNVRGKVCECEALEFENQIFAFPTEEMRDAFKENFDPDIEICKEFL